MNQIKIKQNNFNYTTKNYKDLIKQKNDMK